MKSYNGEKFIISFTSFGKRLEYVPKMLFSLIRIKSVANAHICLTLYKDDVEKIPRELQLLIDHNYLELLVADIDYGPHLKYYYAMRKYYDFPIITVDDDRIYTSTSINLLFDSYEKLEGRKVIITNCAINIMKNDRDEIQELKVWQRHRQKPGSISYKGMAEGFSGILYPRCCFDLDEIKDGILDYKYDDDLYLKLVEIKNRIPVYKTPIDYREELSRNIEVMMQYNLHMNQNAGNINRNNLIQKSADILLKSFEIK